MHSSARAGVERSRARGREGKSDELGEMSRHGGCLIVDDK